MKLLILIFYLLSFASYVLAQETVEDIDGNLYHTVIIDHQIWMVENLKVIHYNDGASIPLEMDENNWSNLTTGAYSLTEENSEEYQENYGVLYNFFAVVDKRELCPDGWHVPTASDWRMLIDNLGGTKLAGGVMKDINSQFWKVVVDNANNNSGFSAFPSGGRGRLGSAGDVGYYATWWSSTSEDEIYAWHWGLYPDKNKIRFNPGHKNSGFSVRCIKDD